MKLTELYDKVGTARHSGIRVIGNRVIYDDGLTIHQFYLADDYELVPATETAKTALTAIVKG